jgi:hypothetical protein
MRRGTKGSFRLTGKGKPAQFMARVSGQNETGFKQKSQAQVTAAMQGKPPPSGVGPADRGTRKDGKRQFGKISGKAVF